MSVPKTRPPSGRKLLLNSYSANACGLTSLERERDFFRNRAHCSAHWVMQQLNKFAQAKYSCCYPVLCFLSCPEGWCRMAAGSRSILPLTVLCAPHSAKCLGSSPSAGLCNGLAENRTIRLKRFYMIKSRALVKVRLKYVGSINDILK